MKQPITSEITNVSHYDNLNQVVISTPKASHFYSYGTHIATKPTCGKPILTSDWDYSRTTTLHLGYFLNTYSKDEIRQKLKNFEFVYKDNPCLKN